MLLHGPENWPERCLPADIYGVRSNCYGHRPKKGIKGICLCKQETHVEDSSRTVVIADEILQYRRGGNLTILEVSATLYTVPPYI